MSVFKNSSFLMFAFIFCISISLHATPSITSPTKEDNKTFKYHQNSKKIVLKTFDSTYHVELFDAEGNILKTLKLKKNSRKNISTKKMKAGTYFLRYVGNSTKNNSVVKIKID